MFITSRDDVNHYYQLKRIAGFKMDLETVIDILVRNNKLDRDVFVEGARQACYTTRRRLDSIKGNSADKLTELLSNPKTPITIDFLMYFANATGIDFHTLTTKLSTCPLQPSSSKPGERLIGEHKEIDALLRKTP